MCVRQSLFCYDFLESKSSEYLLFIANSFVIKLAAVSRSEMFLEDRGYQAGQVCPGLLGGNGGCCFLLGRTPDP